MLNQCSSHSVTLSLSVLDGILLNTGSKLKSSCAFSVCMLKVGVDSTGFIAH